MTKSALAGLSLLALLAAPLAAESHLGKPVPAAYGTTNWTIHRIGALEFTPFNSSTPWDTYGSSVYSTSPNGFFHANAHIPSGALLTFFVLDFCDLVNGGTVYAWLRSSPHTDPGTNTLLSLISSTTQSACNSAFEDLTPKAYTVNENANDLYVEVETTGGFLDSAFTGVSIYYQLQIMPAPATATFADVPTNYLYFRAIEALAKAGITSGCGGGNFCPNQAVTRGEMAKFLANALGLDWHP